MPHIQYARKGGLRCPTPQIPGPLFLSPRPPSGEEIVSRERRWPVRQRHPRKCSPPASNMRQRAHPFLHPCAHQRPQAQVQPAQHRASAAQSSKPKGRGSEERDGEGNKSSRRSPVEIRPMGEAIRKSSPASPITTRVRVGYRVVRLSMSRRVPRLGPPKAEVRVAGRAAGG